MYAGLEGPLASQRLELWRIGMEDLALLQLLGPTEAQALAQTMVRSGIDYTFNATLLEEVRARAVASLVAQHHRCMIPEKNDGSPPLTTLRTLKSDDVAIPAIVTVAATASPSEIYAAAEVARILNSVGVSANSSTTTHFAVVTATKKLAALRRSPSGLVLRRCWACQHQILPAWVWAMGRGSTCTAVDSAVQVRTFHLRRRYKGAHAGVYRGGCQHGACRFCQSFDFC